MCLILIFGHVYFIKRWDRVSNFCIFTNTLIYDKKIYRVLMFWQKLIKILSSSFKHTKKFFFVFCFLKEAHTTIFGDISFWSYLQTAVELSLSCLLNVDNVLEGVLFIWKSPEDGSPRILIYFPTNNPQGTCLKTTCPPFCGWRHFGHPTIIQLIRYTGSINSFSPPHLSWVANVKLDPLVPPTEHSGFPHAERTPTELGIPTPSFLPHKVPMK